MKSKFFKRFTALGMALLTFTTLAPTNAFAALGNSGNSSSTEYVLIDYHNYNNAKEYYEAVEKTEKGIQQIFLVNNKTQLSWVTAAGTAPNASYLRFRTIGSRFVVKDVASRKTCTIDIVNDNVQHGDADWIGQKVAINGEYVTNRTSYNVVTLEMSALKAYAEKRGKLSMFQGAEGYTIKWHPIVTTVPPYSSPKGAVTQNSDGTVTCYPRNDVYFMNEEADYQRFCSHAKVWQNNPVFEQWKKGYDVNNNEAIIETTLNVTYKIDGKEISGVAEEYSTIGKERSSITVLPPGKIPSIYNRTGYQLPTRWTVASGPKKGTTIKAGAKATIADLYGKTDSQEVSVVLEATSVENTYNVTYDMNGSNGSIASKTGVKYTEIFDLPDAKTAAPTGMSFAGWTFETETEVLSAGTLQSKKTAVNGKTVTYHAKWVPNEYRIHLNTMKGSGETSDFYETYGIKFSLDTGKNSTATTKITSLPTKTGMDFIGYYDRYDQASTQIVDKDGNIKVPTNYFSEDVNIYAHYTPKAYTVNFNPGENVLSPGTQNATAYFEQVFPDKDKDNHSLVAPTVDGKTFIGYYYKDADGVEVQIYDAHMCSSKIYTYTEDIWLYAKYEDMTAPTIRIATNMDWYSAALNGALPITVYAQDSGSGLASVEFEIKGVKTNLSGDFTAGMTTQFIGTAYASEEGVYQVKATATDKVGNTSYTVCTIKIDNTAPVLISGAITGSGNELNLSNLVITDLKF